ncbi:MAG: hypothetical protein ABF391_04350 [Akkermansiaceae bacterium]
MKFLNAWIVAFAFSVISIPLASSCAPVRLPPVVEIEFPIGDVNFRHDETLQGMMLTITSGEISMRARCVYVGDGEKAVKYEASQFGMITHAGVSKRGAIIIKNGERILTDAAELTDWGTKAHGIYILIPNIEFAVKAEEEK